jgi:hypothetical protein
MIANEWLKAGETSMLIKLSSKALQVVICPYYKTKSLTSTKEVNTKPDCIARHKP